MSTRKDPESVRGPEPAEGRRSRPADPYRTLFEQSADAILIIDGETFVDCNQATVDMLRYTEKEELLKTHPSVLSPPTQPDGRDSYEKANEMIAIAFERGSHRFEWDHMRADGEVFPVEVLLTAVPQGDKTLLHVVWRDITERKRLEADLRQSQKMEAIGKLAGGIAHDFNNLLVAILGNAELLEHATLDRPDLGQFAREIRKAAERAADLTKQLLAFSRKQVIQPRVISVDDAIRDLERLLGHLLGESVRLDLLLSSGQTRIKVDPGQIEQVVVNLVANSRDAMPSGGTVTIETHVVEIAEDDQDAEADLPPGRYALLVVADTGSGMTPEVARRAFDPFFTTKEVGEGTGMGLSTVYGIVKQCRGDVVLHTAPGAGTRIEVYLPTTEEHLPDERAGGEPAAEHVGGDETILVVEDEPAVARLLAMILRRHGYRVLLGANGMEALDLYRENAGEIDLVVSDVVMPELGGPEMIARLEREGYTPRVLFASGYMDSTLTQMECWKEGAELIAKPVSSRELLQRVRAALDRRRGGAQSGGSSTA